MATLLAGLKRLANFDMNNKFASLDWQQVMFTQYLLLHITRSSAFTHREIAWSCIATLYSMICIIKLRMRSSADPLDPSAAHTGSPVSSCSPWCSPLQQLLAIPEVPVKYPAGSAKAFSHQQNIDALSPKRASSIHSDRFSRILAANSTVDSIDKLSRV